MHGKSVVDGIGGNVKRFVRERILAQDLLVKSAKDFVTVASKMDTKVLLLNSADIKRRNVEIGLAAIIKSSQKITDIKKKHCFYVQQVKTGKKLSDKVIGIKITPDGY